MNEIYKKTDIFEYVINDNELVLLRKKNEHKIQKFFRKLGLKIPEYTTIELDEISSFVFLQIDGKNSVEEICNLMRQKFEDRIEPCEERLSIFLNYLIDHKQIEIYKSEL